MPAPTATLIQGLALSSFAPGGNPQTEQKLATACGAVLGTAARVFLERVMMEPGVACAVVPPTMTGTVAGVGRLSGSGPTEAEMKIEADRAARDTGMNAADQKVFAETLVKMTVVGFTRFRDLAQIMPGTPVAGGVTAGPARITIGTGAIRGELKAMALSMNPPGPPVPGAWVAARPQSSRPAGAPMMGGHRGGGTPPPPGPPRVALPADFARIAAELVEKTLDQLANTALVAPGIPIQGTVTAGPGRLM